MSDIRGHRTAPPSQSLLLPTEVRDSGPNGFERTVRVVLHLAAIVALVLASLWMVLALRATAAIGDRIDQINAPAPAETGCPFGDDNCGG